MAQHISIRVPWHDSGYAGNVCKNPKRNIFCRCLRNIASKKNDGFEQRLAGCPMAGREGDLPCVGEGAAFMSPDPHEKTIEHPYFKTGASTHMHYLPTVLRMPPYSAPARPFGWTLLSKFDGQDFAREHGIGFDRADEPSLGFSSSWVQGRRNQERIFSAFFGDVEPKKSLCFFYAKRVPFTDDRRRVIIGIGLVEKIMPAIEYRHKPGTPPTSMTWETMVCHSIRPDCSNGILFPYGELSEHARRTPGFDIDECTVFVEDDFFNEFSYASEHVSDDAAISILLNALHALEAIGKAIPEAGDWNRCIRWVGDRLHEAQVDRGAYPGLGAVLYAFGFDAGFTMARQIPSNGADPWDALDEAVANPSAYFEANVASSVTPTLRAAWAGLPRERKDSLKLVSRLSLTCEQAKALVSPSARKAAKILLTDAELLENPYLLYERTSKLGSASPYRLSVHQIDRALFPPREIAASCPLPGSVPAILPDDRRRIRAYCIAYLEERALQGHTVYPASEFLSWMENAAEDPPCRVTSDILAAQGGYMGDAICASRTEGGDAMLQLRRLRDMDELIERTVRRRTEDAVAHRVDEDWERIMEDAFKSDKPDEREPEARREKAAVLRSMAASRLFVLVGGAGTGKTTLLSLFCKPSAVNSAGIVCLAPTGKARVKISESLAGRGIPHKAYTIAQFLMERDLFDATTGEYRIRKEYSPERMGTAIVDECSMLTEEMMGSLMQALGGAERIVLTGDPKQLPPIGAGRPFVDLVNHLSKGIAASAFPRVGTNFAELTIPRRQRDANQIDLARLFRGEGEHFDDSLFGRMAEDPNASVAVRKWGTQDEFENLLVETLVEEIPLENATDAWSFGLALGGEARDSRAKGRFLAYPNDKDHLGKLDGWQILTPVYGLGHGSANINHLIHERFRDTSLASFGSEGITYGDRIINSKNNAKPWVAEGWRPGKKYYLANGEIGIVNRVRSKKDGRRCLVASFANQYGLSFDLTSGAGDFEGEPTVELAYSLTVHKVQGSGFEKVVLVIGEPCRLITRELLYTALTRQTEKLIILYNDEPWKLAKYASERHSETAKRLTRLFTEPTAVTVDGVLYEGGLIHLTIKKELVRSESEVVIANLLCENGYDYEYAKELVLDGVRAFPAFTINDAATGRTWYWEHLGMLREDRHKSRWKEKLAFYERHGIVEGANLVVTQDGPSGPVGRSAIQAVIDRRLL